MMVLLGLIRRSLIFVVKMPLLAIEYKVKKRRFINEFSAVISQYPLSSEAKGELCDQLEQISLLKLYRALKNEQS